MTEKEIYERAISLLDSFHENAVADIKLIPKQEKWRNRTIFNLFRQSTHISFALLSNSEGSKFRNETYVTDLIFFGSLGRILRDIYVNVIYLKTNDYSEEEMELCWEYQTLSQKLNLIQFETDPNSNDLRNNLNSRKSELLLLMNHLTPATVKRIKDGRNEKLIGYERLAEIKQFKMDIFKSEFEFFSQFAHSTAFANSFIKDEGLNFGILAIVFDKIVAYHVGIVTESLEFFLKDHKEIESLKQFYDQIIKKRWT